VSCGVNIWCFTSILVPYWLKGFRTMNTVALSYITYLYTAHYVVVSYILLLIVILLCS